MTEGIRKPDFDKINRSADMNPQKGRHLLCTFCPYEMRSMSRKGRELCPNGAKREGKPRYSGATLRAHVVVSPLNFSAESSLHFFCEKMVRVTCGILTERQPRARGALLRYIAPPSLPRWGKVPVPEFQISRNNRSFGRQSRTGQGACVKSDGSVRNKYMT